MVIRTLAELLKSYLRDISSHVLSEYESANISIVYNICIAYLINTQIYPCIWNNT